MCFSVVDHCHDSVHILARVVERGLPQVWAVVAYHQGSAVASTEKSKAGGFDS